MATKLETLKKEIGYTKDGPKCANCVFLTMDRVKSPAWRGAIRMIERERNIRCSRHGFAAGKASWCRDHQFKPASEGPK